MSEEKTGVRKIVEYLPKFWNLVLLVLAAWIFIISYNVQTELGKQNLLLEIQNERLKGQNETLMKIIVDRPDDCADGKQSAAADDGDESEAVPETGDQEELRADENTVTKSRTL